MGSFRFSLSPLTRKSCMKQLIIGACLAGATTLALAQSWPTAKPIRIIVAYPAGA